MDGHLKECPLMMVATWVADALLSDRELCLACWMLEQLRTVPEGEGYESRLPAPTPWPGGVSGGGGQLSGLQAAGHPIGHLRMPPPP